MSKQVYWAKATLRRCWQRTRRRLVWIYWFCVGWFAILSLHIGLSAGLADAQVLHRNIKTETPGIATPLEERLNQALRLTALAAHFEQQRDWVQASAAIEQAIALLNDSPLERNLETTQILAQALNLQGSLQFSQRQALEALQTWQQAEAAYQSAADEVGMLGSQLNQARAMQSLGLYRRAATLLEQIEPSLQRQPDSLLKVSGLWELGHVRQLVGDLNQARETLLQSLAIAEELHVSGQVPANELASEVSRIWLSLGNIARDQGDRASALAFYGRAIATAPDLISQLQAQVIQLSWLVESEQWSDAQTLWAQIQPQLSELPPAPTAVYIQITAAHSLMQWMHGHGERAEEREQASILFSLPSAQLLTIAVQQARDLGDRRAESYAVGYLGQLYEATQQWEEAQAMTQQALALAESIDASDIAYQWYWQTGRLLKAQQVNAASNEPQTMRDQAIAAYTEAINLLQLLRSDLVAVNPDVQFSFRESVEPVYRQFVELLLQSPDGTEPSQDNLIQARQVIEQLQLAELDNFFREACLDARPVQIDQIDSQAGVIYPIILPHQLALILSLPNQPLHYYKTVLPQEEAESLIAQMRQSLRPNSFIEDRLPIAQKVYDLLLQPLEEELANGNIRTLVFVPDGSLRNLPMSALYDGQHYLIERYSIALTPSLQLFQPRSLEGRQLRGILAGLSQPRQGFPALPHVILELTQIDSEISAQVLLDQSFTTSTFQARIDSAPISIAHLATHGQFSSNADETFILTWDGRINVKQLDQLLQARAEDLNPIELLVLSACQTAAGDRRAALGMAGVAVQSGARSTLATLWSVSDRSTAMLMVYFYRELRKPGVTKAEALRQAQLALLQQPEYQAPYFWAPFVLLGNWL